MGKLVEALSGGVNRLLGARGRSDDPLSSLKSITRWVENLPAGDALKAQQALLAEVKRFNENIHELTPERLEILMLLATKSQDLQATLAFQYLRNPRMSRVIESQLWHAIYNLNWEIVRACHSFTVNFSRNPSRSRLEPFIPLATLCALRGFRQLIKWRFIRYQQPSEKMWLRLHHLYLFAENEGFHQKKLSLHANEPSTSQCEREYLHALMLDLANPGSLYPRQIDLIDRWLESWLDRMPLSHTLDAEQHVFAAHLHEDRGARRIRKTGGEADARYWSTLELLAKLKTLHARLKEGEAPARVGLTEDARVAESVELLELLERQWAPLSQREQRRRPRHAVKRVVEVVHGFAPLLTHVKGEHSDEHGVYGDNAIYEEATDLHVYGFVTDRTRERASQFSGPYSTLPDTERWVMENESECGYGATIETQDKDWLRVGALVGLKADQAKTWSAGIVRRLSRFNESQSSVGIEILPEPLSLAMLYGKKSSAYEVNGIDTGSITRPVAALMLESEQTATLILDPAEYAHNRIFEYTHLDKKKLIQLEEMGERGEGWIQVRFSTLSD